MTELRATIRASLCPRVMVREFGTLDVRATDRNIVVGMPDKVTHPTQFNARITQLLDPRGVRIFSAARKTLAVLTAISPPWR